uniref:FLYWCH-type domain-containing protein n=1 Tax=Globodera pallida TaxID=36090 RepID=A0A183C104_GLOPA
MHQFQRYDSNRPRTVTSFKGNQKLIFEGYRYNIHHIVPTKGVKTWRCVCAKKLTCSRSWCKGRAETWDEDGQGISKGEHNHPAEHEVAELEYFKSQLILAAIASPNANLNELIDEAIGFMSEGVSFGSRESLKKSLTVARKAAENGGFKLKCYKSSDKPIKNLAYNNIVPSQHLKLEEPSSPPLDRDGTTALKCSANAENNNSAHVMSLLSLANQCRDNNLDEKKSFFTTMTYSPPSCCPPSSAISLLDSSGFHSGSSLNCSTTCPSPSSASNSSPSTILFAAVAAAAAAALNNTNNSSTKKGGMVSMCQKKAVTEKSGVKLSCHAPTSAAGGRPTSTSGPPNCVPIPSMANNRIINNNSQLHNAQIVQRKKARVNSIFDRLSTKAAAAAATTSSSSTSQNEKQRRNTEFNVAGTQTDVDGMEEADCAAAHHPDKGDGWRVVRICCCGDNAKCTRGQKRKWTISSAEADEFDENVGETQPVTATTEEHSPPPSTSSSVENQPQHNGKAEEHDEKDIGSMVMVKTMKQESADDQRI